MLQDDELQPEQLEPDAEDFSTPLMAKVENLFFTSLELHLGHATLLSGPKTSCSNSCPHPLHLYSNIGIALSLFWNPLPVL